jgi:hypothetical protein
MRYHFRYYVRHSSGDTRLVRSGPGEVTGLGLLQPGGAAMAEKAFRVLTVRSAGMTAQPALYPLLGPSRGEVIAWEPEDENEALTERLYRASGITVSQVINGAERPILSLRRLKINVYITAGRLALACERYKTADALEVTGTGTGLSARGVTSARVSRRLQGGAIVGHIRYPWMRSVSPRPRSWRFGRDTLIIEFAVSPQMPMLLRLDLRWRASGRGTARENPDDSPMAWRTPEAMAADICTRVVTYWQTHPNGASPAVLADFAALGARAAAGPLVPSPGKAETYQFPAWHPVTPAVPFLRRSRRSFDAYEEDEAGEE